MAGRGRSAESSRRQGSMTIPMMIGEVPARAVAAELDANHYLGRAARGWAWCDEWGVMVVGPPTSRMLPTDWLELSRWCLRGIPNGGSSQWARVRKHILESRPHVTTVVSYSDPNVGHTGALYRACGWVWAPTWHRIKPPPTGGGSWDGGETYQVPKDRWVACLRPDSRRADLLSLERSYTRGQPWLEWREPPVRRGLCEQNTGGADFKKWKANSAPNKP
jgi:hypothetical protein